jgi:hypothetical protein
MNDEHPGLDKMDRFMWQVIDAQSNVASTLSLSPVGSGETTTRPVSGVISGGVPDNSGAASQGVAPETGWASVGTECPYIEIQPPRDSRFWEFRHENSFTGWFDPSVFRMSYRLTPAGRFEMSRRAAWVRQRDSGDRVIYGRHAMFDRRQRYGVSV